MSVESEILRIQHNIANTYAAVAEKGGEVPLQPTSANLAAAVASIPSIGIQLESIEITEPPAKTKYVTGDTFDPTGMSVYATYSSGQTMYVDHANLIFDPSGPLEEGTTYVTVKFQWGPRIESASQAIEVVTALFSWWSPHMTSDNEPAPFVASASEYRTEAFKPYNAFDGKPSTDGYGSGGLWITRDNVESAWVQIDFGRSINVKCVRINPGYSNYGIQSPEWLYVSGSNDGENWADIATYSNIAWASMGGYTEFPFNFAQNYRFYRIGADNISSSSSFLGRLSYGDIQFYVPTVDRME